MPMAYHKDPFSSKSFTDIFLPWLTVINQSECLSIVHIPKRHQLYRVKQLVESKKFLNKYLENYSKYQIIGLDLAASSLEDIFDVENYLTNELKIGKTPIILLLDADILLKEKKNLIPYFDSLHHKKIISIIYFFQRNIFYEKYLPLLTPYSSFFQNSIVFPYYYSKKDSEIFISHLETNFCKITEKIKEDIVNQCGGCFWLIKQAVRHYCQTKDLKSLFNHEEMKLKLNILYHEYEPEERVILQKIAINNNNFLRTDEKYLNYLLKTKLISKEKKLFFINIPILENLIREEGYKKQDLYISQNQTIEMNGVNIEMFLSSSETKLIKEFLINKGKVVTRQRISEILWGNKDYFYTDWALDQRIWRLRKKLSKLNITEQTIQTAKNKGYMINVSYGNRK